ncbi:MAG: methyltransferase domain-containing protein [Promethearchaeota archaeon]|jgi:SAM-dependent methyltransferase
MVTNSYPTTSKPIEKCQICESNNLESIVFLGYVPPVNTMPDIGSIPVEQVTYPLEMLRCKDCTLVQIGLEVEPSVLFPYTYPYLSSSTRILRENFADLYRDCSEMLDLLQDDLIVDIGSNDGTLLANFNEAGHRVLGVEPSQAGVVARERGIETLTEYFDKKTARVIKEKYGQAKLVAATNVFAHIGNIDAVLEGIIEILTPDGVFINESHYLLDLVETLQYDTIYHEHLRYYSVKSLNFLLNKHELDIFSVKRIPTHGGSIRVYATRKYKREIQNGVREMLKEEAKKGITNGSALQTFQEKVIQSKMGLMALLSKIKNAGAKIYGIGAPSRSSTLINYTGLDDGVVDAVVEISTSHKIGKYIPGTRIPVLDEKLLFENQPEYALLLSWHIAEELMGNLRKKGFNGKFITPLPEPKII